MQPTFTLKHNGHEYDTPEAKAQLFWNMLHPQPPAADLTDLNGFAYPTPLQMPPITVHEVTRAIKRVAPGKAPGPDGIPNLVLQRTFPILGPFLTRLFNSCI